MSRRRVERDEVTIYLDELDKPGGDDLLPRPSTQSGRARRHRRLTNLPPVSSAPVDPRVPARRVVIAEDEALIRMDLAEMLAEEGYDVVGQAGDGETAVELAEQHRPDLVVLDVKMPRLDGIAAAQRIASQRIAPVVILTAFSQRDLVERARDAGAMAYLVKPFTKNDLVPAVEMAMSRFAELQLLEAEVARPDRPAGDPQAGRPGQGGPAGAAVAERAGRVPVDPEDRDGPAAVDAPGRGGRDRARPGRRRAEPRRADAGSRSEVTNSQHDDGSQGPSNTSAERLAGASFRHTGRPPEQVADGSNPTHGGSMIRNTRSWRVAAAAVAAGLTLAACGTTDDSDDDSASGDGDGASCDVHLAFLGPETGDYANLGINIVNGAKVAIDEFNADNPDCKVELKEFDSQGDPEKATPLADEIINDDSIIGVVGPTFSGETDATGTTFAEAGLVDRLRLGHQPRPVAERLGHLPPRCSATTPPRRRPPRSTSRTTLGAKKVFVVDDASEYGKGIADGVAEDLGDLVVDTDTVQLKQTDFSATVTKVKASGADALFYGGYYAEAGLLVKQLRAGGWEGTFVSGDGSKDPASSRRPAPAPPRAPPDLPLRPGDRRLRREVQGGQRRRARAPTPPRATTPRTSSWTASPTGNTDREGMLDWVNSYDADGLTKQHQVRRDRRGRRGRHLRLHGQGRRDRRSTPRSSDDVDLRLTSTA